MLKDNLIMLRNMHSYSQEEIAEKINISRQAYAKWESGATVPDIEKCSLLAEVYGVTLDKLVNSDASNEPEEPMLAPKGKNIWGTITINDRGQIVIPKPARDKFNLVGGTRIVVLSDESGIALVAAEQFEAHMQMIMKLAATRSETE